MTSLSAKLFALNPKLTPTAVVKLILDGAMKSSDGKRLLINPKARLLCSKRSAERNRTASIFDCSRNSPAVQSRIPPVVTLALAVKLGTAWPQQLKMLY